MEMIICLVHFFGIRLLLSQLHSAPPQETLRPRHVERDRPAILGKQLGLPGVKLKLEWYICRLRQTLGSCSDAYLCINTCFAVAITKNVETFSSPDSNESLLTTSLTTGSYFPSRVGRPRGP